MLPESTFQITLLVATFLCTLTTGFIFIFAIVVMPGIGRLDNREFLQAFQVMDRVIQNNQPLFVVVWVGSAITLVIAGILGFRQLEGVSRFLIIAAVLIYIIGTQLPTVTINIPLNNRVQRLDLDTLNETALVAERQRFEGRWNRWNIIRMVFASVASILLLIVVRLI